MTKYGSKKYLLKQSKPHLTNQPDNRVVINFFRFSGEGLRVRQNNLQIFMTPQICP